VKNRHNIKVQHWEMTSHLQSDRAELRLTIDVPKHDRIWGFEHSTGLENAIGAYLGDRTKPRWQRVWGIVRGDG
jgi:hypothetical protein